VKNSYVCVTIATRDTITREEQLKCEKEQILKVIDTWLHCSVKKEGIIIGHLPWKIS